MTSDPDALVFPLISNAASVSGISSAPEQVRRSVASQVLEIFNDARHTDVALESHVLLPTASEAKLIDIIDLNPNNFLIRRDGDLDIVHVVDFEQQGNHYAWRNRMHLSQMLLGLGCYRVTALLSYISGLLLGVGWLLRYQIEPMAVRIRNRQPSLASVVVADFRSVAGRVAGTLLTLVGLGEK